MKKIVPAILILLLGTFVVAEEILWHTDLKAAEKEALETNRLMLLYFTGSDWCQWCLKLDNELFGDDVFREGIGNYAVRLELDFPQRPQSPRLQRQNNRLKADLNVKAIPEVVVYDPKSKEVLWRHGYVSVSPEGYLGVLESIRGHIP